VTDLSDDLTLAAVTADLLRQGRSLHVASVVLTVAAGVGVPLLAVLQPRVWPMAGASLALLFGLAEAWFALRVGFDRQIFERFAGHATPPLAPSQFDRVLVALGLATAETPGRTMADRVRGCARLLRLQVLAFVLQIAALLLGGWLAVLV